MLLLRSSCRVSGVSDPYTKTRYPMYSMTAMNPPMIETQT